MVWGSEIECEHLLGGRSGIDDANNPGYKLSTGLNMAEVVRVHPQLVNQLELSLLSVKRNAPSNEEVFPLLLRQPSRHLLS